MTTAFAGSTVDFLDMAANQMRLAELMQKELAPVFGDLGLTLDSFVVENVSLPEELQKMLDQRISMNMLGDMGKYTQFQAAQSLPIAAANPGGVAGLGVGFGAGMAMGQQMVNAMNPAAPAGTAPAGTAAAAPPAADKKFCTNCGQSIGRSAKFCPECGTSQ
jgi:membrane protease subunit (stomatin/prohibitin family)